MFPMLRRRPSPTRTSMEPLTESGNHDTPRKFTRNQLPRRKKERPFTESRADKYSVLVGYEEL